MMRVEIENMVWWRTELGDGGSGGDGVVALAAGVIVVVTVVVVVVLVATEVVVVAIVAAVVAAVVVGEGLSLNRAMTSRKNELKEPLIDFLPFEF